MLFFLYSRMELLWMNRILIYLTRIEILFQSSAWKAALLKRIKGGEKEYIRHWSENGANEYWGIFYGTSITVTMENLDVVTSKEFIDTLYKKDAALYFMLNMFRRNLQLKILF